LPGLALLALAQVATAQPPLGNKRLHVLLVIDTFANNADNLGFEKDGELMKRLLDNIRAGKEEVADSPFTPNRVRITVLDGRNVTKANITGYYNQLKARRDFSPDDALLLYYAGHGHYDPRVGHYLFLNGDNALLRRELLQQMIDTKARLVVLLTDSCADLKPVPVAEMTAPGKIKGGGGPPPPPVPNWRVFQSLFFEQAGVVDINSCQALKKASGTSAEGGFFGVALRELLCAVPRFDPKLAEEIDQLKKERALDRVTWRQFTAWLKRETLECARARAPGREDQVPVAFQLPGVIRFGALVRTIPPNSQGVVGVLVTQVAPDSPASRSGFRRADVIVSLGGKPVPTEDDFAEVIDGLHGTIKVTVRTGDYTRESEREVTLNDD
jgi:hypothetical protein